MGILIWSEILSTWQIDFVKWNFFEWHTWLYFFSSGLYMEKYLIVSQMLGFCLTSLLRALNLYLLVYYISLRTKFTVLSLERDNILLLVASKWHIKLAGFDFIECFCLCLAQWKAVYWRRRSMELWIWKPWFLTPALLMTCHKAFNRSFHSFSFFICRWGYYLILTTSLWGN